MRRPTTTILLVVLLVSAGCSIGGFAPDEPDAGEGGPGATVDGGPGATIDGGSGGSGPDPDTDGGSPPREGPPPVQAFEGCAAGGVAAGDGVRAVQCFGPWQVGGRERTGQSRGETVRWQPGAFRVVSED